MKNEEANLYNKYAYDYLYTREGEEGGENEGEKVRKTFVESSMREAIEC